MKRKVFVLSLIPFLIGCASSGGNSNPEGSTGYFKQFEEQVEASEREYTFIELYDAEQNRFQVSFIYDLHFGYSLRIVEYDLFDWYHAPNEGKFSNDYESVIFEFTDFSSSSLFKRGEYILYHSIVNEKDSFKLKAVDIEYNLTTTKKDTPIHINGDLVGTFVYKQNNEELFSIKSEVSSKEEGLVSTITLKEENKEFSTSNLTFGGASVTFIAHGNQDGEYIKDGVSYVFSYNESTETWKLKADNNEYALEKKDEEKPTKDGYFYTHLVKVSNSHVVINILNELGEDRRHVQLSELDQGGKSNFTAFFYIDNNGESLINQQSLSGNIIFTSDASIELRHSVVNNADKIDLYRNNQLLYDDLVIE